MNELLAQPRKFRSKPIEHDCMQSSSIDSMSIARYLARGTFAMQQNWPNPPTLGEQRVKSGGWVASLDELCGRMDYPNPKRNGLWIWLRSMLMQQDQNQKAITIVVIIDRSYSVALVKARMFSPDQTVRSSDPLLRVHRFVGLRSILSGSDDNRLAFCCANRLCQSFWRDRESPPPSRL
jgi:hypothetical protein